MAIGFDGDTMTITLSSGDEQVTVAEIYSAWKDWVKDSHAQYLPAFRVVGGDPLGGGVYAATNVFVQNDVGWRIKPPEEEIQIEIVGNLYPEDPGDPWLAPTTGNFDTCVTRTLSSNLLLFDSGGGGGGEGPYDEDILENTEIARKILTNKTIEDETGVDVYEDNGVAVFGRWSWDEETKTRGKLT